MKTRILFPVITLAMLATSAFSQKPMMELTFTATNNGQYVPLDSIYVENLAQGGDTTLYAPDTVLVLEYITGISHNQAIGENTFSVSQNYPNPFVEKTEFNLYLPEKEHVLITVRDVAGRELTSYENILKRGSHTFSFYAGDETNYLLTVTEKRTSKTIKMLHPNNIKTKGRECSIIYQGYVGNTNAFKSERDTDNFGFNLGDELRFTGYSYYGTNVITDSPTENTTYTFQYTVGAPCPDMPTVTDIDGNTYNTIQIGDQCWMAENLKTTTYRDGTVIPNVTDNEAWESLSTGAYVWYDNDISWKDLYGALYNWYAVIDTNGLCPVGWHVPTEDDWNTLYNFIGGVDDPHGNELKSCRQVNSPLGGDCNTTEHPRWDEDTISGNYGTNFYGFSALPGGFRLDVGTFSYLGKYGYWWYATEVSESKARYLILNYKHGHVGRNTNDKRLGYSVRCLRDY